MSAPGPTPPPRQQRCASSARRGWTPAYLRRHSRCRACSSAPAPRPRAAARRNRRTTHRGRPPRSVGSDGTPPPTLQNCQPECRARPAGLGGGGERASRDGDCHGDGVGGAAAVRRDPRPSAGQSNTRRGASRWGLPGGSRRGPVGGDHGPRRRWPMGGRGWRAGGRSGSHGTPEWNGESLAAGGAPPSAPEQDVVPRTIGLAGGEVLPLVPAALDCF